MNKCKGCRYAIKLGLGYCCNYLEITGHSRQLICKIMGKGDVCTVREAEQPLTMDILDARQPQHKYDMKAKDIASVKRHNREAAESRARSGGVELSFDERLARHMIEVEGMSDLEVSDALGVKISTLKSWRQRRKIPANRKRRTNAQIQADGRGACT